MGPRLRSDLTHPGRRPVRVRLPELPAPLRAMARPSTDEPGMVLEAELPWLRIGSPVFAQFDPGHTVSAEIVSVDVTARRDGVVRLRIHVTGEGLPAPEKEPTPPPKRWRALATALTTLVVAMLAVLPLLLWAPSRPSYLASKEPTLLARVVTPPPRVKIPSALPEVDVISGAKSIAPEKIARARAKPPLKRR